jgi:hypothetical protein
VASARDHWSRSHQQTLAQYRSSIAMLKRQHPADYRSRVDRLNQNDGRGSWAIFDVKYSASDNYDPGPVCSFEPITANQPVARGDIVVDKNKSSAWNVKLRNVPGRTYTLRVSELS